MLAGIIHAIWIYLNKHSPAQAAFVFRLSLMLEILSQGLTGNDTNEAGQQSFEHGV